MAYQTKVVMLLILTPAALAPASCPFGWVKYGGRCFIYQASRINWASAEKHCQTLGGHLVSIHSEGEYQTVKSVIRTYDHLEDPTWIGLNGCQKKNTFFWSDGTKLTFTKWNPGEPNFFFGECCVHMNWSGRKNWNDIPCMWNYPFVCAKSIN